MEIEEAEEMHYEADHADDHAGELDLAAGILAKHQNSGREHHQDFCTVVGKISQTLKDNAMPLVAVSYFGATAATLDRYSRNPDSATDAAPLLQFLSILLPKLPPKVLRAQAARLSETLSRILGFATLPARGVKKGLKCASQLLAAAGAGAVNWSGLAPLYSLLLRFIKDPRDKVRSKCHSRLADVLSSFKGSAVLVPATKEIQSILERAILLGSQSNSSSGAAANEILYILDSLRGCLPLMSPKFTNNFLKYFKKLLDVRQSFVTKKIVYILYPLCNSELEVAPELLLGIMCSIAASVDDKGISADELASRADLLRVGTLKAYALNREATVVKLPTIFTSLGEILSSGHKEAVQKATDASIKLIHSCLDESLVKQGVEQIDINAKTGTRQSGPTLIEKICATIQGFLSSPYDTDWDNTFQVLSAAFDKLGNSSVHLMTETIRTLADMEKLPEENFPYKNQLHKCIGSAIVALGPEIFLSILPLDLEAEDSSDANIWLLTILKQYIVGARLSYFMQFILDKVKLIQQKSHKLEAEGRVFSARNADGLIYNLWSLLPAFCNYPVDTSSSFKNLQEILCNSLRHEHELHGIICNSLQILIRQNSEILSERHGMPEDELHTHVRKAKESYTLEIAEENLKAIRSFSFEFFSVLSEVFLSCPKDNGGCLQSTIHELAAISDTKVVNKVFKRIMRKLLDVTQQVNSEKQHKNSTTMEVDTSSNQTSLSKPRSLLLDLAVALLPGLGIEEVDILFSVIKSTLPDEEGFIQKKAYKGLSTILKENDGFLSRNFDELLELMVSTLPSCHFSAKHHRLDSLYFLVVHIAKGSDQRRGDIVGAFLTEIILALKEANKKTRNRAYDLLVKIGHACGDEEQGGRKETLQQFFNMIAGGLAGETPHMISAAVTGLARLAYEFSDLIGAAYNLLPSAFLLLQRRNREIAKANLGLMKVLVAKSNSDGLQAHLKGMVEGLLTWQDNTKIHFKAKVKSLIDMLVGKCGLDAVKAVMPEEHMKLLTNIRKTNQRKERKGKSQAGSEAGYAITTASRPGEWNHSRIFSDFGDDGDSGEERGELRTHLGGRTKASTLISSKAVLSRKRLASKRSLPEDSVEQFEDGPLDLLDRGRTRSALQSSAASHERKPEPDDEPEIDSEGRLVVREERRSKLKKEESAAEHDSDARSQRSSVRLQKRRKMEAGWAYTGTEYTSKKASGEFKKKDKVDPYAYWPLDRKLLNRRSEYKAVARKGMASVMKFAKRLEGRSASGLLAPGGMKKKKKGNAKPEKK